MNWRYIGIAALLPLIVALGLTLAGAAVQAIRLNREGGSSRTAWFRLLRTIGLLFPMAFLVATLWDGWRTWRGLVGVGLGRAQDQRAMGFLRTHGEGFLLKDPAKAAQWFQKAAKGGDAEAQLRLARVYLQGNGLAKDPEEGLRWARAAAEQGLPEAMVFAGDRLRSSAATEANVWYQRALRIYLQRIQARDADACLAYGQMRFDGKGAERDRVEGLAWMYVSRRMGVDPIVGGFVQLREEGLSQTQRMEASQRAVAILGTLPHPR